MRALLPILLIVAAMASIQTGAAIAKLALFPHAGAMGTTALRVSLAALILLVVWRPWRRWPRARDLGWIAIYGAALGVMNLLFYLALRTIPLGVAVALEFTGPLAVAILGSHRPLDFAWAALAAAGVILLLPLTGFTQALDPLGIAFALGAGACWAAYIVFGKRAGQGHAGTATAIGMVVAALIAAPVGYVAVGAGLFDPRLLPAALAVAVMSSALPYSLEMVALKRLPQRTFGILMSLEPAIGALSGLVLLHEQLSAIQLLAVAAIIAASVGAAATARMAPPTT